MEKNIKYLHSEYTNKANETVGTWDVDGKKYYEFNDQGLYFSLYDNKEKNGEALLTREYIEKDWADYADFENFFADEVLNFLKRMDVDKKIDPQEYFENLKRNKQLVDDETLGKAYESCCFLMEKSLKTGQEVSSRKLMFFMECIEKERDLVKLGVNSFIYKEEVEKFVEAVEDKVVKIIELKNYEREIPDEIVDIVSKTKNIFTDFYVLFTDYTGETEKRIEKEKRKKDPILFGVFNDVKTSAVVNRFYVLGDWEDDYCDLTLDEVVDVIGKEKVIKITTPKSIEEFRVELGKLKPSNSVMALSADFTTVSPDPKEKKSGIFRKVRRFFKL